MTFIAKWRRKSMNKDELVIIKPTKFNKTKRKYGVDVGVGNRAYETLKEIREIVEYFFGYPCDFGEMALYQIREKIDEFDKEEIERLKMHYDEMQRQDLKYSNYINDGD